MGSRSRKRRRSNAATPTTSAASSGRAADLDSTAAAVSAQAAADPTAGADPHGPAAAAPPNRSAKTEAKNQAVRETLEPLAPGERPPWVTYAALFALVLGVLNIALYAAGVRPTGANFTGTVLVGLVLLVCAAGLWKAEYWAVLGFEVVLGVTTTFGALSLLVASSVAGAVRALLVIMVCGTFFWKLIRAMARLQMPERPGPRSA